MEHPFLSLYGIRFVRQGGKKNGGRWIQKQVDFLPQTAYADRHAGRFRPILYFWCCLKTPN